MLMYLLINMFQMCIFKKSTIEGIDTHIFNIFRKNTRLMLHVFEISNVHNERNINLKFVILVRIRLNGFSGDCKSKKWVNKVFIIFKCN